MKAASIDLRRVRKLSGGEAGEGPVLYWMSRDQRAALLARERGPAAAAFLEQLTVHDRSWGNRPVIGGIRPMTAAGCRRKFNLAAYIGPVRAVDASLA